MNPLGSNRVLMQNIQYWTKPLKIENKDDLKNPKNRISKVCLQIFFLQKVDHYKGDLFVEFLIWLKYFSYKYAAQETPVADRETLNACLHVFIKL